ncbi:MAG: methyl-accepting chemotaxis protein [Caloramator sp.]|jgi:methyl-accepting chemotaxis protein|uniref:methyl-accepting chemotaxis protein n=1 Tax=Caloramator sp. TaxID=1871330 RepID=UPI001D354DB1|nr:methyl-accepting chemotaxis protein [Caloramator sp.]MBZ4662966.1 methyl-accepting chemotaxis protein [Caloramator sp.]
MVRGNSTGSKNLLKNIKMISLILILIAFMGASLIGISLLGMSNMRVLSGDMNNLYNERMLPSLELKHIETEFYKIRLSLVQMVYSNKYDEALEQNINKQKDSIDKILEHYRNTKMNEEQKKMLLEVEGTYNAYMENSKLLINKLKTGQSIAAEEIQNLKSLTENIQNAIDTLVQKNASEATIAVDRANLLYSKSRNIMLSVSLIMVIISAVFAYLVTKLLKNSMAQINYVAEKLSQYDFAVELDTEGKNEFIEMNKSLSKVIDNMKKALAEIKENTEILSASSQELSATSEEMASSSQELAKTMEQVAEGATSQANDLQDIVNLIADLTTNIENVYAELRNVKTETDNTTDKANIGKKEMDKLIKSIEEIKNAFDVVVNKVGTLTASVKEINNITNVINAISEQTNLLALNAAIEAARAGEAGRGFAVVADEVRKLAEESKKSTAEIVELVNSIQNDTDEVIKTSNEVESFIKAQTTAVENTVNSFADILDSVENIAPLMNRTYDGMDKIVKSKDEVLSKVEGVSAIVEENTAASEEVAASSQEISAASEEVAATAQNLSAMAMDLANIVSRFKVE